MSQDEAETKIAALVELHAKWIALRDAGGSSDSGMRSELQASLKAIELDLEDLEDAVSIAKGDRTQEKESVEQREAFIATARSRLASVADSLAGSPRASTSTTEATEPAAGTATPSATPPATQAAMAQAPITSAALGAPTAPTAPPPPDDPVPMCKVPNCSVM
mmetsp:Transcript_20050/g.40888  ORF Transcript_20050/g.40888 Transcript_20050/m.40888 type:complete len:163 (+) Transcript_20050:42-530(+)